MKRYRHILLLFIIFLIAYSFYQEYQKIIPKAKEYGKIEVEKFVNVVVNHASLSYHKDRDEMIIVERDDQGDIISVDFDLLEINEMANELVYEIETHLNYIINGEYETVEQDVYATMIEHVNKNKGIVANLPLSSLTNNPILSYLGLKIPIKYEMISNVKSDILTDIQNYGINHVIVRIEIKLIIQQNVVSPLFSEPCIFEYDYPLLVKLVNGSVPDYYSVHQN